MEKNGKWQLAFWIISGFLVIVLVSGVPAIIANDLRIEKKVDDFKDCVQEDITEIKMSIVRIETAVMK